MRHSLSNIARRFDLEIDRDTPTEIIGVCGLLDDLPEHLKAHALFIAYAPLDVPEIAIAIIVENGGSGSRSAAPIARRLIDHYFKGASESGSASG